MTTLTSIKDERGTQRLYETVVILRPDTNPDQIASVNRRVRNALESTGGKVVELENWGKRKLAYEIHKELKGIYIYWKYLGSPSSVAEIERNLRLAEQVIRYLTIRLEDNVYPEKQASLVTEETYIKASTTVPDEEELALRSSGRHRSEEEDEFNPELEELALTTHPEEK